MPLTGQAKTDYQREYMRKRRAGSNGTVTITPESVRPEQAVTVRPKRLEHEQYYHQVHCNAPSHIKPFTKGVTCSCRKVELPKPQSHNPMMVGYLPPQD